MMPRTLRHLGHRPSLLAGLAVAVLATAGTVAAGAPVPRALLIGWNLGVIAYGLTFWAKIRNATTEGMARVAMALDEGRWGMLTATVVAAIASLGAIVAELARAHGTPHAGWAATLGGITVILSWFFIHTIFATHYAHEFWRQRGGLTFPGNDSPGYGEFLYFSFCIAVASQVSDVATQSAGMRRLVLVHSLVAYLFNTAVIALGVNIAASLAS